MEIPGEILYQLEDAEDLSIFTRWKNSASLSKGTINEYFVAKTQEQVFQRCSDICRLNSYAPLYFIL